MIYTFLSGIDAIFIINKLFLFHTTAYFLTYVISIVGWIFLGKNKSLLKSCLGFIFLPVFPLFNTLYFFGSDMSHFHIENFLKFGGLYFTIFVVSLVFILLKTKDNNLNKSGKQIFFIVLSGLMIFTHSCIELITNFENYLNPEFFCFSIILIVFYYLRVLIDRLYNGDVVKSKKLNIISNILFLIYIVIYDFTCFGMAAASV